MPFYSKETWTEARNLVELSDMPPKEVADRLKISYETLKQKMNSQKWLTRRRKKDLKRKGQFATTSAGKYELKNKPKSARDILEEKILETKTKWQGQNIDRSNKLANVIDKTLEHLEKGGDIIEPSELGHLVKSHNELNKNIREATGLFNMSESGGVNNIAILNIPLNMLPKIKDLSEDNFVQIE